MAISGKDQNPPSKPDDNGNRLGCGNSSYNDNAPALTEDRNTIQLERASTSSLSDGNMNDSVSDGSQPNRKSESSDDDEEFSSAPWSKRSKSRERVSRVQAVKTADKIAFTQKRKRDSSSRVSCQDSRQDCSSPKKVTFGSPTTKKPPPRAASSAIRNALNKEQVRTIISYLPNLCAILL